MARNSLHLDLCKDGPKQIKVILKNQSKKNQKTTNKKLNKKITHILTMLVKSQKYFSLGKNF